MTMIPCPFHSENEECALCDGTGFIEDGSPEENLIGYPDITYDGRLED